MAKGLLGKTQLTANTNTVVYSIPLNIQFATISVKLTNTTTADVVVRLAASPNTTPASSDFMLYDVPLPANGVMDVACELYSPGEKIIAHASAVGVSVRVTGLEQD